MWKINILSIERKKTVTTRPIPKKITKVSRASISAPGNLVVNHTTMFFWVGILYGLCGLYLVTPQSHCYYCEAILFILTICKILFGKKYYYHQLNIMKKLKYGLKLFLKYLSVAAICNQVKCL